jgi:hypothetical protein
LKFIPLKTFNQFGYINITVYRKLNLEYILVHSMFVKIIGSSFNATKQKIKSNPYVKDNDHILKQKRIKQST